MEERMGEVLRVKSECKSKMGLQRYGEESQERNREIGERV